ncbi:hypothetical protein, partial [Burkholderia cenocepacia]|uniref:hypothetical protein n=1 Tax=Burkholderia cenocepacia TaxID=95486 RepID=UPI001C8A6873
MANPIILDFYYPSPSRGRTFSSQLDEFRTNSTSLSAIVKNSYQDQDLTPSQQNALAYLAFG